MFVLANEVDNGNYLWSLLCDPMKCKYFKTRLRKRNRKAKIKNNGSCRTKSTNKKN